MRNITHASMS